MHDISGLKTITRWCAVWLCCVAPMILHARIAVAESNPAREIVVRAGAYDNSPKVFIDPQSGEMQGIFPDLLAHIAEAENWRVEYIFGTWSECLDRLEKGDIDIMVDVAYSPERAEKFHFSNETVLINWGCLYSRKHLAIESLLDLQGKSLAVMKNSIHTVGDGGIVQLLKKFNVDATYIEVDDYTRVFEMIDAGEADAGVVNRIFGNLHENAYDIAGTPVIFNPRQIRFAFSKIDDNNRPNRSLLKEHIDAHLARLKADPDSFYHKVVEVYLSGQPREMLFADDNLGDGAIPLSRAERHWINAHPVVRIGCDPEFAPFEFLDENGTYSGIASDYIELLQKRLGIRFQMVKETTWARMVEKAEAGEIDVLPCVGKTRERLAYLDFSMPYIRFQRVIITRTDFPFIAGIRDIQDKRVAVQAKTSHDGYLKESTTIKPRHYKTLQASLLAVSSGEVDALVGNIASATFWIRRLNLTNLKIAAAVSPETRNLYFAVRKDWPELVTLINKGLASITPETENRIYNKWVSVEHAEGIAPQVVWSYAVRVVIIAGIVLTMIVLWNLSLKREITRRRTVEAALKHAAVKLSAANSRLKELDQLKSMFIASMSHELRTPLNSIIGFTSVILQGMSGELNERQKDQLSRVYHSARHLLALITDVIDISKIEAGRVDVYVEEFSLQAAVDEALDTIHPQAAQKELRIETNIPESIVLRSDRKRVLQSLINFLSNAVKYSENGAVIISAETREEQVAVSVRDTGIGIKKEDLPKLFEAFERLDSHLKIKAGGTGLGLYLTRKIVTELLRGTVNVESTPDQGSTFSFTIPVNLEPASHNEELPGENSACH